jgi:hypothetical protein
MKHDALRSISLAHAVTLYHDALAGLCESQNASVTDFRVLTARYSVNARGEHVVVTVEDKNGRRSIDEYRGIPLKHIRIVDGLGRIRAKRK